MSAAKRDENRQVALILTNTLGTGIVYPTGVVLTDSTPIHVAIVDGIGDQITSFGGGTQYTDGGVPPAHPVGNTIEWSDGSFWQTVSTAKPLPVTASFSPSGTQDVNLTKIAGAAISLGQKTEATSIPVVFPSDTDYRPSSGNITVVDSNSTTVTGQASSNIITGTPTANSYQSIAVNGQSSFRVQISGTWVGTLAFEMSIDGGTRWGSFSVQVGGSAQATGSFTGNGIAFGDCAGATNIRVRATAFASGTAIVQFTATEEGGIVKINNAIRIMDNTSLMQLNIKPASTAPLATDTAVVVALSPNVNLASGQPVINGEQTDFTGTFTNATQTTSVTASGLDGYGNVLVSINGTYGTATAIFEGSDDGGTTWYTIQGARDDSNVIETGYTSLTNISRTWEINKPNFDSIRVRSTAVASGTVNVRMSASATTSADGGTVAIGTALPAGTNLLGKVSIDQTTPGTTNLVVLAAETTKVIGTVNQGTSPWVISGSVTANAGTNLNTSLLALESGGNLATLSGIVTSSRAAVNPISGQVGVAAGAGASGATTQRLVVANDAGKTLISKGGSAASNGDNTLVTAGTNRLKVYAFSLSTLSTTAITCIFQSGASGTELWRVILQAGTSVSTGANLVVQPPAWLFATAGATLLNLNLSSANAVHWAVSYYDEA